MDIWSVLIWIFFLTPIVNMVTCAVMIKKHDLEMTYSSSSVTRCHKIDSNQVQLMFGITLSDCVLECGLREHCMALSYHRQTFSCLLLRTTTTELNTESKHCTFILKHDIIVHKKPCDQPCDEDMTCDQASGVCKYAECVFPRPVNANVLGNMANIGSKVRYKCNEGTVEEMNIFTATCHANGTWSYIAKCFPPTYKDCDVSYQQGKTNSGIYLLTSVSGQTFKVWCDMSLDTQLGWIVIQRRVNASDFFKTWEEYKTGFGDLNGNFWLGNENIWTLTKTGSWVLRIDLTFEGEAGYAEYSSFSIGDETTNYVLSFDQYIAGNVGDSLLIHNGMAFSTKDRDNDLLNGSSCAVDYIGGWWYRNCHSSNLNGVLGSSNYGQGVNWYTWQGHHLSMTTTEMKIREIGG